MSRQHLVYSITPHRPCIALPVRHGDQVGGLIFYDGPMPGSDYLAVHAECGVTLSLLQHRLNELNTGIRLLTV